MIEFTNTNEKFRSKYNLFFKNKLCYCKKIFSLRVLATKITKHDLFVSNVLPQRYPIYPDATGVYKEKKIRK